MATASVASSTGGSSANLLRMGQQQSKCGCNFVGCLNITIRLLLLVILIITLGFVIVQVVDRHEKQISITCYECIAFDGVDVKDPGLPYEKNCLHSPKNARKCLPGQLCSVVRLEAGSSYRIHRSCADGNKTGCVVGYKPVYGKYCFCNSDHCLK